MKKLIFILVLLGVSQIAVSQNKIIIPDSVTNYKIKPISLYLNEQSKGFFQETERSLYNLRIPFNSITYNSFTVRNNYNKVPYDRLNPYRSVDPFTAVLEGTLNYLFNKSVYQNR